MRKLPSILIAVALSALCLCSVTIASLAADGQTVKSSAAPYKPGREIGDDASASASNSTPTDGTPVETGQPPYKPGRELEANDGEQPVTHSQPPYKPGRQAEDH